MKRLILVISILIEAFVAWGVNNEVLYQTVVDGVTYEFQIVLTGEKRMDESTGSDYFYFNLTNGKATLVDMFTNSSSYGLAEEVPEIALIPRKIHVSIHKKEGVRGLYSPAVYEVENDLEVGEVNVGSTSGDQVGSRIRRFKTIAIPKELTVESLGYIKASEYMVEPEGAIGNNFYCENGMLINWSAGGNIDSPQTIAKIPDPFNDIVLQFPERMRIFQDRYINFYELGVPLVLNQDLEKIIGEPFCDYPFFGIEIPRSVEPRSYRLMLTDYPDVTCAQLRAFENCNLIVGPDLKAGIMVDDLSEVNYSYLLRIYGKYYSLEYVQFNTTTLPEMIIPGEFLAGSNGLEPSDRKVVTYVRPELLDGFKAMQGRGEFPVNADLRAFEDFLYLYPQLDFGKWHEGRCQAVSAICRFGNSEVVSAEWSSRTVSVLDSYGNSEAEDGELSSDSSDVATVDENGVVTAVAPGRAYIMLTVTDRNGNQSTAGRILDVTEKEVSSVPRIEKDHGLAVPARRGVYNLHGIYLGESVEGLPAGLYIVDGKKKVVKI